MFKGIQHIWLKTPHVLLLSTMLMLIGMAFYAVPRLVWPGDLSKLWQDATALAAAQVITAGTVGIVLRSITWKEAIDKALERVRLRDSVLRSGLIDVLPAADVDYGELLSDATHVELALISARHFIASTHASRMIDFLRRGGTLDLIVSDPADDILMQHYDRCFGEELGTRKIKTLESLGELARLCKNPEISKATVRIWLTRRRLTYAYHRFDDTYVVTLYKNQPQSRDTTQLPAFVYRGGLLSRAFSTPDLESLRADARKVETADLDALITATKDTGNANSDAV
jgi:hypothetical protein